LLTDKQINSLLNCLKSNKLNDCLEWTGALNKGYGWVTLNYNQYLVHRVIYEHFVGKIPTGYEIDHLCRNPKCSKVDHLEAVTPWTNQIRIPNSSAALSLRKACKNGHLYNLENTKIDPTGRRHCRVCRRKNKNDIRPSRYVYRLPSDFENSNLILTDKGELLYETERCISGKVFESR
jgi:hypothetical protein